jgi:metallo-beta-lactamase family protein
MESTYGGRIREKDPEAGRREFIRSVAAALERGGDVLIPAFTLGRTQEVIALLEIFRRRGVIPENTIIYSDSPTARRISDIYRDNRSSFTRTAAAGKYLDSTALREVRSASSLPVHGRRHAPAVFISSSGNLQHANSPRHLMRMFDDQRNLLCLVGWQPPGSLGRRLQRGEDPVLVSYSEKGEYHKKWIRPELEIRSFSCFSGHADQRGLLEWLGGIRGVKKVFLVHGDYDQSRALRERITGMEAAIPERGERIVLAAD